MASFFIKGSRNKIWAIHSEIDLLLLCYYCLTPPPYKQSPPPPIQASSYTIDDLQFDFLQPGCNKGCVIPRFLFSSSSSFCDLFIFIPFGMVLFLVDYVTPDDETVRNLSFQEGWQIYSLRLLNLISNSISIVSAITVLVILLAMRLYDRRFVDRVSLRLTAAISMTDLVSAISLVVYTLVGNDGPTCSTVAFLIIWLSNQYIFLSTAIAFNLQWLYLQDRYYNPAFEKW